MLGLAEGCPGSCPSGNTRSLAPSERNPHVESDTCLLGRLQRSGMIFAEETSIEHSQKLPQYVSQSIYRTRDRTYRKSYVMFRYIFRPYPDRFQVFVMLVHLYTILSDLTDPVGSPTPVHLLMCPVGSCSLNSLYHESWEQQPPCMALLYCISAHPGQLILSPIFAFLCYCCVSH